MSEDESDESVHMQSFVARCPKCGTYSDHPDKTFFLNGCALASEGDFVLWEMICQACDISFDVAVTIGPDGSESIDKAISEEGSFNQELLERYKTAVNDVATLAGFEQDSQDGRIAENKGHADADFEFLNLEYNLDFKERAPIIPMDVLTLARGVRMAVAQSPERIFGCTIGPYTLVLSLDQLGEAKPAYAMHVSISNRITGERLTDPQVNFLIGLILGYMDSYDLHEVPPTIVKEVEHYYIPWSIENLLP